MDTTNLRNAIAHYVFTAKPSNASASAPATVGDVNRVINKTAELLNTFLDELEGIDEH